MQIQTNQGFLEKLSLYPPCPKRIPTSIPTSPRARRRWLELMPLVQEMGLEKAWIEYQRRRQNARSSLAALLADEITSMVKQPSMSSLIFPVKVELDPKDPTVVNAEVELEQPLQQVSMKVRL